MAKKHFEVTQNSSEDVTKAILDCINHTSPDLRIPVGKYAKLFFEMHDEFSVDPQRYKKWFTDEMEKMFEKIN